MTSTSATWTHITLLHLWSATADAVADCSGANSVKRIECRRLNHQRASGCSTSRSGRMVGAKLMSSYHEQVDVWAYMMAADTLHSSRRQRLQAVTRAQTAHGGTEQHLRPSTSMAAYSLSDVRRTQLLVAANAMMRAKHIRTASKDTVRPKIYDRPPRARPTSLIFQAVQIGQTTLGHFNLQQSENTFKNPHHNSGSTPDHEGRRRRLILSKYQAS